MNSTVAPMVPVLSATSGLLPENWRTIMMPAMEHRRPREASPSGRNIRDSRAPRSPMMSSDIVDAIAMVAIIAPQ